MLYGRFALLFNLELDTSVYRNVMFLVHSTAGRLVCSANYRLHICQDIRSYLPGPVNVTMSCISAGLRYSMSQQCEREESLKSQKRGSALDKRTRRGKVLCMKLSSCKSGFFPDSQIFKAARCLSDRLHRVWCLKVLLLLPRCNIKLQLTLGSIHWWTGVASDYNLIVPFLAGIVFPFSSYQNKSIVSIGVAKLKPYTPLVRSHHLRKCICLLLRVNIAGVVLLSGESRGRCPSPCLTQPRASCRRPHCHPGSLAHCSSFCSHCGWQCRAITVIDHCYYRMFSITGEQRGAGNTCTQTQWAHDQHTHWKIPTTACTRLWIRARMHIKWMEMHLFSRKELRWGHTFFHLAQLDSHTHTHCLYSAVLQLPGDILHSVTSHC